MYVIASLSVGYTLVVQDLNIEFVVKLVALLSLSFLYLETTYKVNYWYVLILLISILSDSLFVFEADFYYPALFLLIVNRFLYIVVIKSSVFPRLSAKMFIYVLPFILTFIAIYTLFYRYIDLIRVPVLLMGALSVILVFFTFLNLLNKNNNKARYFFWGTTLMPMADILMAFSDFVNNHISFIIIYHLLYYWARYLIYKSMILRK